MFMCTHMHAREYRGQILLSSVFLSWCPHYLLAPGLLVNLELINAVMLSGQQAQGSSCLPGTSVVVLKQDSCSSLLDVF